MIARYFSQAVVLIRLRSGPIGPVLVERTVCVDGSNGHALALRPKQIKTPLRSTCSNRAKPCPTHRYCAYSPHGVESLRLSGFGGDSFAVRNVSQSKSSEGQKGSEGLHYYVRLFVTEQVSLLDNRRGLFGYHFLPSRYSGLDLS
jgi:hypothetical protein